MLVTSTRVYLSRWLREELLDPLFLLMMLVLRAVVSWQRDVCWTDV